jgi:hypothetical protein
MAHIFFSGKKAPEEEAIRELEKHVAATCDLVHVAKFESDDGGKHIASYVEVEDPSILLEPYLKDVLHHVKWMGWRHILIKVPPGQIEMIINKRD